MLLAQMAQFCKSPILRNATLSIMVAMLGTLLNMIVMGANGGMPVPKLVGNTKETYDLLNLSYPHWTGYSSGTQYKFLADVLPWNLSIGDILMFASVFIFVGLELAYIFRKKEYA